jgi:flagellar protein FlbT
MALKLSLKPFEKFVVNGAVVQNGDRRSVLLLQNKASVLREKDIMQPEEVVTPARHIYFPVMMMYLEQEVTDPLYKEFVERMTQFMTVVTNREVLAECVGISRDVMAKEFYKALGRCRKLMAWEEERLGNVISGVPESSEQDLKSA